MVGLVRLLGIIMMLIGIAVLVRPALMKKMIAFVKVDKRVYWSGGIKTLVGIIFLLAATECKIPFVIAVMGILFVMSLVICLAMGDKKIKSWIEVWEAKTEDFVKVWSLVTIAIGALITFSA